MMTIFIDCGGYFTQNMVANVNELLMPAAGNSYMRNVDQTAFVVKMKVARTRFRKGRKKASKRTRSKPQENTVTRNTVLCHLAKGDSHCRPKFHLDRSFVHL
jgi:hypothetical protein